MPPVRPFRTRRLFASVAALTVLPLFLLADTGLAFARGWWTTSSVWAAVVGLAAAVLAFAAVLVATRGGRAFLVRRTGQLVLVHLCLAGGWVLLEGGLELAVGQNLWFHRRAPHTRRVLAPKPGTIPGISGRARYTCNALGMRGPELPADRGVYRILCIGGSTTACLYLDDTETWPRLLRDDLAAGARGRRFWVADVGKSGYGTWQHVRFLAGGGAGILDRIDCLVALVGINDFGRALSGRRIDTAYAVRPLWDHSNVLTILHNLYQARKDARRHRNERNDASSLEIRRRLWRRAERLPDLPDLTAGLDQYATNLRAMIRLARAHGVRIVFATQPVLWQETGVSERARRLCWFGRPDGSSPSIEKLAVGMRRFNEGLRRVCAENGVECVDLEPMNGHEEDYYDDCHFTEAGGREVARRIAAALLRWGFPAPGR